MIFGIHLDCWIKVITRFNGIWNKMPRPVAARRRIVTVCSGRGSTHGHAYTASSPLFTLFLELWFVVQTHTLIAQLRIQWAACLLLHFLFFPAFSFSFFGGRLHSLSFAFLPRAMPLETFEYILFILLRFALRGFTICNKIRHLLSFDPRSG